jgi:hypothetical protein
MSYRIYQVNKKMVLPQSTRQPRFGEDSRLPVYDNRWPAGGRSFCTDTEL